MEAIGFFHPGGLDAVIDTSIQLGLLFKTSPVPFMELNGDGLRYLVGRVHDVMDRMEQARRDDADG